MNQEQKEFCAAWCAALRSGEYKQGKEFMKKGDAFCCLGVCSVLDPEVAASAQEVQRGGLGLEVTCTGFKYPGGYIGRQAALPDSEWFEQKTGLPLGVKYDVAGMNDKGKSFSEIADYIEEMIAHNE